MTDGIRNARFWVYVNSGWVKVTLRYGDTIEHREGGPTEEGYHVCHMWWTHNGMWVRRNVDHDARDCDGRYMRRHEDFASLVELGELPLDPDLSSAEDLKDVSRPRWQGEESFYRDHTAEAAGY